MPIVVNLDVMLARRKMQLSELAEKVDITLPNLSILKTGKAKAVRFSTLEAICEALNCQPEANIIQLKKSKLPQNFWGSLSKSLEIVTRKIFFTSNYKSDS
eukprot:gene34638-57451_t